MNRAGTRARRILSVPSPDEAAQLLRAWRVWTAAALLGALFAALLYLIAPPPYRARATVLIDFNLEEAWPEETDRQQFYYLERETRKLEEIAWSDRVLSAVADADGLVTVASLRGRDLHLAQPGDAGWHFYADSPSPRRAELLASTWAQEFVRQAFRRLEAGESLSSFTKVQPVQVAWLPVERSVPLGTYLLAGALLAMTLSVFALFFVHGGGEGSRVS